MAQTNTPVSADDQKKIDAFGEQWKAAQAAGDKAGMDAAHTGAENIRAQYGYSGGGDGSGHHPLEMTIPTAGAGATQAGMDSQTTQERSGKIYQVQANGRAPQGLGVGDQVVTGGGTYSILSVNPDGTYKSKLVNADQTTQNYTGSYNSTTAPTGRYYRVGADGKSPSGLKAGDQVVTGGGTYIIEGFNEDGSYRATLVNKAQTSQTYRGEYATPGVNLENPTKDLKAILDQWFETSKNQSNQQIDYATEKGTTELNRALEDAAPQFQTQRNQLAANEARALDNSALYAEARGDRGGIGQAQYNEIQSAALQTRQAINAAQTKLATDTARQIADLRAQGEFEKADNLLKLTQQKLSQLMSLEQWGAQYAMSQEQMRQSLEQWQKEYELNKANVTGYFTDGTPTRAATESAREAAAGIASALLEAGIMPNDEQLKALGMTAEQAQSYITAKQLQLAAKSSSSRGRSRGGGGGSTSSSSSQTASSAKDYTVDSTGNASVIPARSLSWDQDEGTFVWNGKTYSKVSDLVNAWNNASLSDEDEAVLRRKFKSQTGVDLSKYGY
jgi:hypothetical protein